MCGIVGVVSRPPTRPTPTADRDRSTASTRALAAVARRRRRRGARSARSTRCCAACPACWPSSTRADAGRRDRGPPRPARRLRRRGRAPARRRRPSALDADELGAGATPTLIAPEGRAVGDPPRPPAHGATRSPSSPVATPGRRRSPATSSIQQALSAIDRLEVRGRDSAGLHVFVWDHGLDSPIRRSPRSLAERGARPAVPVRRRSVVAGGVPVVRLQGGGRDRRARRQHRGAARRGRRRRRCCAWRSSRRRRGSPCSATPAGRASGSSPSRTPTRSTATSSSSRRGERRRPTSSPRSTATSTTTPTCASTHGLRIAGPITTDAKVIPTLVARATCDDRRRPRRGVPPDGRRRSRARSRSARRAPTTRARCCSRCAAAARALYVGLADDCYIVASEPYGVVEETDALRAPRRRARRPRSSSCSTATRAGTLDGIAAPRATTAPTLPVDRRRGRHAPRSRPATSTAATPRTSC